MALILPYPNTPLNGQPGDPVPINANFTAIAQAIQAFDGSQISAATIVSSALNSTINPITRDNLIIGNFVSSGCIWSTVSGLQGTMSSGTLFINGNMVTVNGVISNTFTASKDTYIDIDYNGNIYYQAVANGAASPSLTANSIRVAKVITGASISSIQQFGEDSLGNTIYYTNSAKQQAWTDISSWSTVTGWASFTNKIIRYTQVGKTVQIQFILTGTSNAVTVQFTVPIPAKNNSNFNIEMASGLNQDNGTTQSSPARIYIDPSTNNSLVLLQKAMGSGSWTNSGTKDVRGLYIYEAL